MNDSERTKLLQLVDNAGVDIGTAMHIGVERLGWTDDVLTPSELRSIRDRLMDAQGRIEEAVHIVSDEFQRVKS